jgi:CrcB protein
MQWLLIAIAGAVGAVTRYAVVRIAEPWGPAAFPSGTLAVNVSGSLILGFLVTFLLERGGLSNEARLALTVGLLGAYTTFSTFSVETLTLMQDGRWGFAVANVGLSIGAALAAAWAGQTLARL